MGFESTSSSRLDLLGTIISRQIEDWDGCSGGSTRGTEAQYETPIYGDRELRFPSACWSRELLEIEHTNFPNEILHFANNQSPGIRSTLAFFGSDSLQLHLVIE